MDKNTRLQARQYVENFIMNIASCLQDMCAVYKEEISGLEFTENVERNILNRFFVNDNALVVLRPQKRKQSLRVRFYASKVEWVQTKFIYVVEHAGGGEA